MGSSPSPPDPARLATEQAEANRINIYSPHGSSIFGTTDADGNFVAGSNQASVMMNETPYQQEMRLAREGVGRTLSGLATTRAGELPTTAFSLPGESSNVNLGALGFDGVNNAAAHMQTSVGNMNSDLVRGVNSRSGDVVTSVDPMTGQIQRGISSLGLPSLPGTDGFGAERNRAEGAVFGRAMNRLGPLFARQRESAAADLQNRGIALNSDAYNEAMDRVDRQQADQLENVAYSAVGAGGDEQSRMFGLASQARGQLFGERATQGQFANQAAGQAFGQNLTANQFRNQALQQALNMDLAAGEFANRATGQAYNQGVGAATFNNNALTQQQQNAMSRLGGLYSLGSQDRARQINESLMARNQGINEFAQLMGGVPTNPIPQAQGAQIDVITPQMAAYQAQLQNQQGLMGGLFGLGQAGLTAALL